MTKLKNYVASHPFADTAEEKHFFKTIKPRFYSRYIYLISVYNFVIQKPAGSEEAICAYINDQFTDVKRFFDHNRALYQYYPSSMNQLDDSYYTRGGFDIHAELEDFDEDELYSTNANTRIGNCFMAENKELL